MHRTLVYGTEREGKGTRVLLLLRFVKDKDGQATKGTRRMPWHQEAKKGVVSCEKLRLAARRR